MDTLRKIASIVLRVTSFLVAVAVAVLLVCVIDTYTKAELQSTDTVPGLALCATTQLDKPLDVFRLNGSPYGVFKQGDMFCKAPISDQVYADFPRLPPRK